MTKDEALKLALEALHGFIPYLPLNDETQCRRYDKAITAIKEALANDTSQERVAKTSENVQEPVAWISATELLVMRGNALGGAKDWRVNLGLEPEEGDVGLYTTPPQRKPLTDEEIINEADRFDWGKDCAVRFAKAIEAAHGIKGEV
jgi:hypothetical protein